MTFSGTKCDSCGTVKQEANHWFRIYQDADNAIGITLSESDNPLQLRGQRLMLDICGQDCLIRKVSELTGNLK